MGITGALALGEGRELRLTILDESKTLMLTLKDGDYEETLLSSAYIASANNRRSLPVMDDEDAYMFHSRSVVRSTPGALLIDTCPVGESGAPVPAFLARYEFTAREGGFNVRCWFDAEGEKLAGSIKWLPLKLMRAYDTVRVSLPGKTCFGAPVPDYVCEIKALCHPVAGDVVRLSDGAREICLSSAGGAQFTPRSDIYGLKEGLGELRPGADLCAQLDLSLFSEPRALEAAVLFGAAGECARTAPPLTPRAVERAPECAGEVVELDAGAIRLGFIVRPTGVTPRAVSLDTFSPTDAKPLLPLSRLLITRLSDGVKYAVTTERGWKAVRVSAGKTRLSFYFESPLGIPSISLRMIARVTAPGRIEWKTQVLNSSADYSVLSATYPSLTFEGGEPTLIAPQHSGEIYKDIYSGGFHHSGAYPNGFTCTMPVYMLYGAPGRANNGLYVAVHDAGGARKDMRIDAFPGGHGVIDWRFGAINMGEAANAFELAGTLVISAFTGDYFDGARIYKDFVTSRANWLPGFGRPDTPDWMRDTPMYIMDWMPNENPDADPIPVSIRPATEQPPEAWYEKPIRLADALGNVPIGYHLYNWHWNPFNNDFPHYFPVKPALKYGVNKLLAHNVRTMPYINGRLWDTLDKRDEDWQFTSLARPQATKRYLGDIDVETYASHEPDGNLCRLAAMCPSSALWREKLSEIAFRLFDEYGMSAVYIDQVAAASANMCVDKSHSHLPGNGDWWVSGYRLIMARLREEAPEGRGFTTESNAETYADSFDGFLTWAWISSNLVPVFPFIYAGYIQMLGRNTNGYKKPDTTHLRFHIAQCVMFGQQIGWINADVVDDNEKLDFLKLGVGARYEYREFFARGEMLRPPVVNYSGGAFVTDTGMGKSTLFVGARVVAGAWRLDKRVIVMAASVDGEARKFALTYSPEEYGIQGARARLARGAGEIRVNDSGLEASVSGADILVIEFTED